MASDPNQGQPKDPASGYGAQQNPYGTPSENPYATPQNPYGTYGPPPENPYATPAYSNQEYSGGPAYGPPSSTPLPLGQAIRELPNQYIKVLTKPGAMTFAEEMGKASWDIVWVQLIVYAIIGTILGYLGTLISGSALNTSSTGSLNPAILQSLRSITLGASFGQIVLIPLFFFIGMAIVYGLARAFGGQGRFLTQGYTFLLFDTPLGILSSLLALIPIAGGIIALAIGIYRIVLAIFAVMAVHNLRGGKASAVILIPIGVVLLLSCALVVVFALLIASAIQHP